MLVLKAFRLPQDLVKRLSHLAKETHRSEKFYVTQALNHYMQDYVEAQIAKDRFNDPASRIVSSSDLRKKLNV